MTEPMYTLVLVPMSTRDLPVRTALPELTDKWIKMRCDWCNVLAWASPQTTDLHASPNIKKVCLWCLMEPQPTNG